MPTFYQEYDRRSSSINYGIEPFGGFCFPLTKPLSKCKKLLSQRNLCISQRMPKLEPFILGLSTPLVNKTKEHCWTSLESKKHVISNSFHTTTIDYNSYEKRNVLCGSCKNNSNNIHLYSVNELGEQKSLYEYLLEYNEIEDNIEIPEYCLKKKHKVKEKDVKKKYESFCPIIEMLMHQNDNYQDKIWLRTTKTLELFDCQNEQAHTVHNGYIKTLNQIPYTSNEICFIDSSGFAWYGPIETSNYTRMKFRDPLLNIATTDSPRTFYGANDVCVFEFDYREYTGAQYNPVIEQKNIMDNWPQTVYDEFHIDSQPLFKIKYLISPIEQTNTLILVTNRFYILFDSRYISRPIMRLSHCIYDGGEYVYFEQNGLTFNSDMNGDLTGKLYMTYHLSKNVEPGVWYNCLFYNEKEDVFGSTIFTSELQNFENIELYFNNKKTEELLNYQKKINTLTEGVYTRSICQISPNNNLEEAFIFRSNSDGSIWYDEIAFNVHNLDYNEINIASINKCHYFWNNQSLSLIKEYVNDQIFENTSNNNIWNNLYYSKEENDEIKHIPINFIYSNEDESNYTNIGIKKNIKEKTDLTGVVSTTKEMPKEYELSNIVLDRVKFVEKNIKIVYKK